MSEEDMEIVRRYFETLDSVLERYWQAPEGSISDSPLLDEVFAQLAPEAEWDSFLRQEPYRGRKEILEAVEDWLDAGENWRVALEEVRDAGDGRVLAFLKPTFRGRGSGISVEAPLYTLTTVSGGRITRVTDYTERSEALEAAGLPE
jgi:ketosteroid isomerase-like protein